MGVGAFRRFGRQALRTRSLHHVVTLNPEMVLLAEKDTAFRDALAKADVRLPDGAGLIWARWYLRSHRWELLPSLIAFRGQRVERVTGVDTVELLAQLCEEEGKKMHLVGGEASSTTLTAQLLKKRYPTLKISVAPDHVFDIKGPAEVLESIIIEQPAVVLVAYGAPKQTVWMERHRAALSGVSIAVGVGGAFDILCERLPRAPLTLQRQNLEWLWRLYLEPRRLVRIWRAVVLFPLLMWRYSRSNPL